MSCQPEKKPVYCNNVGEYIEGIKRKEKVERGTAIDHIIH
jgi:hypothetical protein